MEASDLKVEEHVIYSSNSTGATQDLNDHLPTSSRVCQFRAKSYSTSPRLEVVFRTGQIPPESSEAYEPQRCKYRCIETGSIKTGMLTSIQIYKSDFKEFEKIFPLSQQGAYDAMEILECLQTGMDDGISPSLRNILKPQSIQCLNLLPEKETKFRNFIVKIFTNFLFRGNKGKISNKQPQQLLQKPKYFTKEDKKSQQQEFSPQNWAFGSCNSIVASSSPLKETNCNSNRANQQQSQYHNLKNSFMHLIIQVFTSDVLSCFDLDSDLIQEAIAVIERMKKHSFKYRPVKGRYQYYSNIHYSTLFLELNSFPTLLEIQACSQSKQYHDIFFESNIERATSEKDPVVAKCNFYKQLIGNIVSFSISIAEQYLLANLDPSTTNINRYSYIAKVTKGIHKLQKGKHVIRF